MSTSPATTAERREASGYTQANRRIDNCKGCARMDYQVRDPDTAYERKAMHCKLHGMPVSHGSICEDWVRAK